MQLNFSSTVTGMGAVSFCDRYLPVSTATSFRYASSEKLHG